MLVLWIIGFLIILALRAALIFRPRRRSGGLAAKIIASRMWRLKKRPLEAAIAKAR